MLMLVPKRKVPVLLLHDSTLYIYNVHVSQITNQQRMSLDLVSRRDVHMKILTRIRRTT